LVLAGVVADGVTTIADAFHVDRGYQSFVETLQGLGAKVRRVPDDTLL
jgi:UDP-N-acetylglucosamine 1-carboxyvinyltransferase